MRITQTICLLALVLAVAQVTCLQTVDLQSYSERKWSSPVTLRVGEKLQVILKENPTTGYRWMIFDTLLERFGLIDVVRQSNSLYQSDDNPRGMMGVGGVRTLEFEAIGVGKGDLYMIYARPWEVDQNGPDYENGLGRIISITVKP